MTSHSHSRMPPAPPAAQSKKGPGDPHRVSTEDAAGDKRNRNLSEQGRQGNIAQNTHHQGHQQDR